MLESVRHLLGGWFGTGRGRRAERNIARGLARGLEHALARDRRVVAVSGLFDESYYLLNGNDLVAAGAEPHDHFCRHGWLEGRRPNLFFDPAWYRSTYLAASPDANPFVHYIRQGEAEGCRPICFFDPAWYRSTYGLAKGVSPLAHYLAHRRSQTVAPNPLFDLAFYLARHGDEIGPNRDPFMHLVRNGAALRDCDPSPGFDSAAYRREVMAADARQWTGLTAHEMRVPLIHRLRASCAAHEAGRARADPRQPTHARSAEHSFDIASRFNTRVS